MTGATYQCKKYKQLLNDQKIVSDTNSTNKRQHVATSQPSTNCFSCTKNVPWSPEHAANCPRGKQQKNKQRFFRSNHQQQPQKVIRSAKFLPNHTSITSTNASSSEELNRMDLDDNYYPVNYDCKHRKTNELQNDSSNTNHSLFIGGINTRALIDIGSSFSCLDIKFVNDNNFSLNKNLAGPMLCMCKV
ncbi:hypothetical protein BDF20DRAFT_915132 [Mycotypha africana]|uniref:uncharacterized protein n=1 Tax=Mycotypha africana TaxID=64632 RepID=UPI0023009923|nr:uncharacterized protein BDF20DRAFT_915132 [Mycotypha africana]KAI8973724.1 hypothetical protein BDF20DRAFT_915132 [Mycotypha africana]